jgi:hypothetical protein
MADDKRNIECRHYPLCQNLETVGRDIPPSFSGIHAIVLEREAESICDKCHDFEPEDLAGTA